MKALLRYLRKTAALFARETGVSEGWVSKVYNANRRVGRENMDVLAEKLGLDPRYWTSKEPYSPGHYLLATRPPESGEAMSPRERVQELARRYHAPDRVFVALAKETAPEGADAYWWFECMLRAWHEVPKRRSA